MRPHSVSVWVTAGSSAALGSSDLGHRRDRRQVGRNRQGRRRCRLSGGSEWLVDAGAPGACGEEQQDTREEERSAGDHLSRIEQDPVAPNATGSCRPAGPLTSPSSGSTHRPSRSIVAIVPSPQARDVLCSAAGRLCRERRGQQDQHQQHGDHDHQHAPGSHCGNRANRRDHAVETSDGPILFHRIS